MFLCYSTQNMKKVMTGYISSIKLLRIENINKNLIRHAPHCITEKTLKGHL